MRHLIAYQTIQRSQEKRRTLQDEIFPQVATLRKKSTKENFISELRKEKKDETDSASRVGSAGSCSTANPSRQ